MKKVFIQQQQRTETINKESFVTFTKCHQHQLDVLARSAFLDVFAIFAEQGTGKSKMTIDTAVNLFLHKKIQHVIILAPIALTYNWEREELPKHLLPTISHKSFVFRSKEDKSQKGQYRKRYFLSELDVKKDHLKILIMNLEAIMTTGGYDLLIELLQKDTLLVIDESGKLLKNPRAKRTRKVVELAKSAKYRRILTGTPITKSPLDLYMQFCFLDKNILGFSNFYSFKHYFEDVMLVGPAGKMFPKHVAFKNLDKLHSLVAPHSVRILKKDCLDLPEKIYITQHYELTSEQLEQYGNLKRDNITFPEVPVNDIELLQAVQSGDVLLAKHALTKLLRLQQILSGYMPLENNRVHQLFSVIDANPRVQALLDAVEDVEGKIIIWCRFVHEIQSLMTLFKECAVSYYGEMKQKDRQDAYENFKNNPGVRYFIANPSCAGYGLTINEASTVVYYSNDFNLETRLQSEDRCHRIGQTKNVTYIDIVAVGTIDEHIRRILLEKQVYSTMLDTNINNN